MDTDCQILRLGEESIVFVKKVLGDGLTLARLIKERNIVGDNGEIFALLPEDADVEMIRTFTADQYTRGFVVHSGIPAECLASYIWKYLEEDKNRLCLMQNYDADPKPIWMDSFQTQAVVYGQEIYQVASKASGSAESVLAAIREAASLWIFIGVLAEVQDSSRWLTTPTVTVEDLEDVVEHITHVFVMAFDSEGYVVWQARER